MSEDAILTLAGIEKSFPGGNGSKHVLRGVDLRVNRGELLGLVGESGCGKSTLISIALRLSKADKGSIIFSRQDITQLGFREMIPIRRRLQAVFQSTLSSMDPRRKVRHILSEPMKNFGLRFTEETLRQALESVSLPPELLDRLPGQLSGGQKQRVAIARALLPEPELVLFDEVTSNLDTLMAARVTELIRAFQTSKRMSCVFVTHDIGLALRICDRIAVLREGVIEECFVPGEEVRKPYTKVLLDAISIRPRQ